MKDKGFSPHAPIRLRDEFWWTESVESANTGWITRDGRIGAGLHEKIQEGLLKSVMNSAAEFAKTDPGIDDPVAYLAELPEFQTTFRGDHRVLRG